MLLSWSTKTSGTELENLIPDSARTGVLVVAHPDDESLWCGGLLARRDVDWTVICCSIPKADPERAYKFFLACEVLGAKARLLPYREDNGQFRLDLLDLRPFHVIVTHGRNGEYGHPQHKELYERLYGHENTRFIGYGGAGHYMVPLDANLLEKKRAALACYDHVSSTDGGLTKSQALIDYYGSRFDLWTERYDFD